MKKIFLKGFSLLEVSIAFLIVGIISGFLLNQIKTYQNFSVMQKTQNNIDAIIISLAAYCNSSSDNSLPCPSNENLATIGFEDEALKNGFGIVPFKSLGLMERQAKDGKGGWIFYMANPYFNQDSYPQSFMTLGVAEFAPKQKDKVAFILKTQDDHGRKICQIWMSENNFKTKYSIKEIENDDEQVFSVEE
jgi:prepilin-type N-terminal cleavage/methylation domain-containing protein